MRAVVKYGVKVVGERAAALCLAAPKREFVAAQFYLEVVRFDHAVAANPIFVGNAPFPLRRAKKVAVVSRVYRVKLLRKAVPFSEILCFNFFLSRANRRVGNKRTYVCLPMLASVVLSVGLLAILGQSPTEVVVSVWLSVWWRYELWRR